MDKFKNLEKPIWIQASLAFVYAKTIRAYLRVKVLGLPPCCICPFAWSKVLSKVFLSRRWVGGGDGWVYEKFMGDGLSEEQKINQRENEVSSDPAPLNGERQLWGYLLNFCILIERLTKEKKKSKLCQQSIIKKEDIRNSQSESRKSGTNDRGHSCSRGGLRPRLVNKYSKQSSGI